MTRRTLSTAILVLFGILMCGSTAFAQSWHVNCRVPAEVTAFEPVTTYEQCVDFFSFHVQMGGPTTKRPDLVWTHDGTGWTPTPNPARTAPAPAANPWPTDHCDPYISEMLRTSPLCASFRAPNPGDDTPLPEPFAVGQVYQEPYNAQVAIVGAFVHRLSGTPFWVAECLNQTSICYKIGQTMTLEQGDRHVWTVPPAQ